MPRSAYLKARLGRDLDRPGTGADGEGRDRAEAVGADGGFEGVGDLGEAFFDEECELAEDGGRLALDFGFADPEPVAELADLARLDEQRASGAARAEHHALDLVVGIRAYREHVAAVALGVVVA